MLKDNIKASFESDVYMYIHVYIEAYLNWIMYISGNFSSMCKKGQTYTIRSLCYFSFAVFSRHLKNNSKRLDVHTKYSLYILLMFSYIYNICMKIYIYENIYIIYIYINVYIYIYAYIHYEIFYLWATCLQKKIFLSHFIKKYDVMMMSPLHYGKIK